MYLEKLIAIITSQPLSITSTAFAFKNKIQLWNPKNNINDPTAGYERNILYTFPTIFFRGRIDGIGKQSIIMIDPLTLTLIGTFLAISMFNT